MESKIGQAVLQVSLVIVEIFDLVVSFLLRLSSFFFLREMDSNAFGIESKVIRSNTGEPLGSGFRITILNLNKLEAWKSLVLLLLAGASCLCTGRVPDTEVEAVVAVTNFESRWIMDIGRNNLGGIIDVRVDAFLKKFPWSRASLLKDLENDPKLINGDSKGKIPALSISFALLLEAIQPLKILRKGEGIAKWPCYYSLGGGGKPKGTEFTYALRFQFTASNNEAEYEALIAGLRIAAQMGVRNVHVSVDSKLVANQVIGAYVAKEEKIDQIPGEVKSSGVKHPQSNGLVERANRSLGDGIKARLGEGNKNWIEELPHVLWAHRKLGPKWEGPYEVTKALGDGAYRLRHEAMKWTAVVSGVVPLLCQPPQSEWRHPLTKSLAPGEQR
ncbi:reverse transcriptase domain-containing protein [Tanacetum coccineum]